MKRFILSCLALSLLASCGGQEDLTDPTLEEQGGVQGQGASQGQNFDNGDFADYDQHSATEIANHLANLATEIPDVNRATAIVIGPYAVVGIDVEGDIDQAEVGSIKYQVAVALAEDPYGASAAVTADPDITNRIEEMRVEMGQGRPLGAIMDELAGIVGRIMPIVPGYEHIPRETPGEEDPTDTNNERLDPDQQDELEDIQDEQSHGRMNNGNRNNQN
ncbi:YhcN/YlaJ family sporulation lipoprotein [Evansella vedderi]|uniref:YhcN/YlaJ family sporulation lipoprotein n=1 Tax=Evansella vedderi TaxID=38282 RepID=A0ABT9ZRJ6_9BACI|nr:YhcN/YlaJ family sporulation lipoprotein [Evansella vedderi]MDQ0253862.1 YhcN/YlaJ family sporulation lipoprotein [Evansella vedderi]